MNKEPVNPAIDFTESEIGLDETSDTFEKTDIQMLEERLFPEGWFESKKIKQEEKFDDDIKVELQNKIESATTTAKDFREFLTILVNQNIICLPEIDKNRNVIDYIFITRGIQASSDKLDKDFQFASLKEKIKYSDGPNYIKLENEKSSFSDQFESLKNQSLSKYWWMMKSKCDDEGRAVVNPAAFELLRRVYQIKFGQNIKTFEGFFSDPKSTATFIKALEDQENRTLNYLESIRAIRETLSEAVEKQDNKRLIIQTSDYATNLTFEENGNSNVEITSYEFYNTQPETPDGDKYFESFKGNLEKAGLQSVLLSEKADIEFITAGSNSERYELSVRPDYISFEKKHFKEEEITGISDRLRDDNGIYFGRNSNGRFQYTGSVITTTAEKYPEKGNVVEFNEEIAGRDLIKFRHDDLGANLIVKKADILETEITDKIETANIKNLETYLECKQGGEILAKCNVNVAEHELLSLEITGDQRKYAVTVNEFGKENTRRISSNDLKFERIAIAKADLKRLRDGGWIKDDLKKGKNTEKEVEESYYKGFLMTNEENQAAWIEALNEKNAETKTAAEEKLEFAKEKSAAAALDTITLQKQIADAGLSFDDALEPQIKPEKLWVEQLRAIKRGDAEMFDALEEVNVRQNLPRPNHSLARLRALGTVAEMRSIEAEKTYEELVIGRAEENKRVFVNIKQDNDGNINVSNWRVLDAENRRQNLLYEAGKNQEQSENHHAAAFQKGIQPIRHQIDPFSTITGKLSWLTNPLRTLNNRVNPVQIIKNDPGVQIIRAVAGFVEEKYKAFELDKLAKEAISEAAKLETAIPSASVERAAKLAKSVKNAIMNDAFLRKSLAGDELSNSEMLKIPSPLYTDAEIIENARIAEKCGNAEKVNKYTDLMSRNRRIADSGINSPEKVEAKSLLAQARSNWESGKAIDDIVPLEDGSVDISLKPAQLRSATAAAQRADTITGTAEIIAGENFGVTAVANLSLSDAQMVFGMIGNNEIIGEINMRIAEIGKELIQSFKPIVSEIDKEVLKFTNNFSADLKQADDLIRQGNSLRDLHERYQDNVWSKQLEEAAKLEQRNDNQVAKKEINPDRYSTEEEKNAFWKREYEKTVQDILNSPDELAEAEARTETEALEDGIIAAI